MISLCVDARLINGAGIGSFLRGILSNLDRTKFDITLLINTRDRHDAFFNNLGFSFIELKSGIYSIREQMELSLKIPRVNLFWTPHINVPILPIRANKRIVTIHDCFHLEYSKQFSFYKRVYAHLIYNGAAFHADCLVTDSLFSQSQIAKHLITKKKPVVVYTGIDLSHYYKKQECELQKVCTKYNLSKKYILAVGNVKPHKNLTRLLSAFAELKKLGFSDLKLLIVGKKEGFISGDSALFQQYESHAYKEDIQFIGLIPYEDLPSIYSLAQILIFPSLYEGFGLPPLEAMACQCPVIASERASIPEICKDAVWYVDPLDIKMIANAIAHLLSDEEKRSELRKKGLEHVKNFSKEMPSLHYGRIFEELIKEVS